MQQQKDRAKILVVDDEQVHRYMLTTLFSEWGWEATEADDGVSAVKAVEESPFDAILMDVRMTVMDGMEALNKIHTINPAIPVVIMTAYSSVDSAVEAIKKGAHDYLTKPLDFDRLRETLEVAMGHRLRKGTLAVSGKPFGEDDRIIGSSEAMRALWDMILHVAPTEATVLITGESGTGKELVASGLHYKSHRAEGPFIKVNCAALAESLLESELFGHEKGAFTGADARREGRFVQAEGGTLFLDEIGETTPAMQAKLLRVLQEHELQRVGGQETISVDVRILAATNRDLDQMTRDGTLRKDLLFRLRTFTIELPPLRERMEDLRQLTRAFVGQLCDRFSMDGKGISPEFFASLACYDWPGNVRELKQVIEQAFANARPFPTLYELHLPEQLRILHTQTGLSGRTPPDQNEKSFSLPIWSEYKQQCEQHYLNTLIKATDGDIKESCRLSTLSRARLYELLKKHKLTLP